MCIGLFVCLVSRFVTFFDLQLCSSSHIVFFLTLHPPPRSTLFPYTTLFRSSGPMAPAQPSSESSRTLPTCTGADSAKIGRAQSELQSLRHLVCRLLLEKKKKNKNNIKTRI